MPFPRAAATLWQNRVADMVVHIQQEEYQIPITREQQTDLQDIVGYYLHGTGNFWIAHIDEQVVGTIALLDIGERQLTLRKMFVHQDYRGKTWGVSHALMQQAINWANDHNQREIYLGTTLQFKAAHRFYEKNGFIEIEQQQLPPNFPIVHVDKKFYRLSLPSSV
ncbi:GNAT family N-acetyltransferase [Paenibacillus campi]|uniref:GNAT family N-acetyltransferase n=1 Tax=Paenibacillus campi TaxID=3106031 RepID=UPI002AFF1373|nr:GNAT family N-acetyltransferase [Paenibacillus sp. SGZ-1014]